MAYIFKSIAATLNFSQICCSSIFYPTAHGVWMGGREKVCPDCISQSVRCRELVLGRDIRYDV